ncbi:unnamed protein product [Rhodiola kirilowii]
MEFTESNREPKSRLTSKRRNASQTGSRTQARLIGSSVDVKVFIVRGAKMCIVRG